MTVQELHETIHTFEGTGGHSPGTEPGTYEVRIVLSDPAVGPRQTAGLRDAYPGIDWEQGMFLLCPDVKVFRSIHRMDQPAGIVKEAAGGMAFTACPTCRMRVAKSDAYCRHCGQRLRG